MGSPLYDFLTESFFFAPNHLDDAFAGVTERDLVLELRRYREYCLAHKDIICEDALLVPSTLRVAAGTSPPLGLLTQSALYIEQFVITDPLFAMTEPRNRMGRVLQEYFGQPEHGIDRTALTQAIAYLLKLTPGIAANYLKVLPAYHHPSAPEELPIYASPNRFADILPEPVLQFCRERAIVTSVRKTAEGWVIENSLDIGRAIAICFRDHDTTDTNIQFLFNTELTEMDETNRMAEFRFVQSAEPPAVEYFNGWVEQSVNRAAGTLVQRLRREISHTQQLNASYLTTSPFISTLLDTFGGTTPAVSSHTANTLLRLELPFLDHVNLDTILRVRRSDGEAFQNFRNELDKQFATLRCEPDPALRAAKAADMLHDLSTVQTHQLRMKLRDLRNGALAQAGIVLASFAGGIFNHALTVSRIVPWVFWIEDPSVVSRSAVTTSTQFPLVSWCTIDSWMRYTERRDFATSLGLILGATANARSMPLCTNALSRMTMTAGMQPSCGTGLWGKRMFWHSGVLLSGMRTENGHRMPPQEITRQACNGARRTTAHSGER
jgi:hypothetical protein